MAKKRLPLRFPPATIKRLCDEMERDTGMRPTMEMMRAVVCAHHAELNLDAVEAAEKVDG